MASGYEEQTTLSGKGSLLPDALRLALLTILIIAGSLPIVASADANKGEALYNRHCAFCHGKQGRGDGPAANYLNLASRNFVEANYRIRTTPWQALPTDQDLMKVITNGVKNALMPPWFDFSEAEQRMLVDYIKSFSDRFRKEEIPPSIKILQTPKRSKELVERGQKVYREVKCFLCHGEDGRGDGPITVALESEWLLPHRARDLRKGWTYKRGSSVEDIYTTLVTGMNGTPMGSYQKYLSSEELWALAYYVESISREDSLTEPVGLEVKYVKRGVPSDPGSPLWDNAQKLSIPLARHVFIDNNPRWWKPSIEAMDMKAIYSDTDIALLLEWSDVKPSLDDVLSDAIAIQFPLRLAEGDNKPSFANDEMIEPLYMIHWRARGNSSRQEAVVQELNPRAKSRVSIQPPENQHVQANALWDKGKWKVVLKRKLDTRDNDDLRFEKDRLIPLAFSLWDGMKGEVGHRKSLSTWYYLHLETSTPWTAYLHIIVSVLAALGLEFWFMKNNW